LIEIKKKKDKDEIMETKKNNIKKKKNKDAIIVMETSKWQLLGFNFHHLNDIRVIIHKWAWAYEIKANNKTHKLKKEFI
jgi:K+-sensing histidine kinase KdpD